MPEAHQEHPPVPRLVVRVGVTGHREGPDLASSELRDAVRDVLLGIKTIASELLKHGEDFYSGGEPILRVISPLAEGADRLVAKEAVLLGYELQSPLPFPQEVYEQDFGNQASLKQFQELLRQASSVFEMDYPNDTEEEKREAYRAVGRLVLRQCDLLIAIWDGEPARGTGGTEKIVKKALSLEIPTIWITSDSPHNSVLLNPVDEEESDRRLQGRPLAESLREPLERLLLPGRTIAELQKFLLRKRQTKSAVDKEIKTKKPKDRNTSAALARAFQWADTLATRYAGIYRGSFRATYTLGAFAVLWAYLGSIVEPKAIALHTVLLCLELVSLVGIGVIVLLGRHQKWHERWLDYRHLAESLRMLRLLPPFGRVPSSVQVPAHLAQGDPRKTWFHWYFRALAREAGLASVQMAQARQNLTQKLREEVDAQIEYHSDKVRKCHRALAIGHTVGYLFFFLALVACISHIWIHGGILKRPLDFAVIVLPAFAGSIGAILHHGEYERLVRRSHALEELLHELRRRIDAAETASSSRELGDLADSFSKLCLDELMDWRFLLLDLPPLMPT